MSSVNKDNLSPFWLKLWLFFFNYIMLVPVLGIVYIFKLKWHCKLDVYTFFSPSGITVIMHLICVKIINHKKHLYYFIEFSTRTKPYIFTHVVTISCTFVSSYLRLLLLLPSHSVVSDSVRPHRLQPTRLPRPWDSPGKSAGVGCYCLLCLCLHLVVFSLYLKDFIFTFLKMQVCFC